MKELIVDKFYDGKKLNSFLFKNVNGMNASTFFKLLRKKDIRINQVKVSENLIIHFGDTIQVYLPDEYFQKTQKSFDIVFEDEHICIVNKPTEIEVVGDNSLTTLLQEHYSSFIKPCHRLDRNTSGLVLFAKDSISEEILLIKFKNQEVEKHYHALVYGIPFKEKNNLSAYLFKDNKKAQVIISDTSKKGYVPIQTSYTLLKKDCKRNCSLLDVELHTGKTHQIRAHLAHIGFPIIGDGKYGTNEINKLFHCKWQMLESYSITFHFTTDAGILNYLNHQTFTLPNGRVGC